MIDNFFLKATFFILALFFSTFSFAQTNNNLNSILMGPPNAPQQFVVGEPDTSSSDASNSDNAAAPAQPPAPPSVTTPAPAVPSISTPNVYQTYPAAPSYQAPSSVTPPAASTYQTPSNTTPPLYGSPPAAGVVSITPGSATQPTTVELAPPFPSPKMQIITSPPTAPTYQPPPVGTAVTPPIPLPAPQAIQGPPYHDFQGGLDTRNFIQCEKMGASVCSLAQGDAGFQQCILRLKQQVACNQFVSFASLAHFNLKDDIDFIQHYNEAQLDLVHVIRGNVANYPGDYFVLTVNGDVVNINSGSEAQNLDITKDPQYAFISQRFPKVGLWSIIDQAPQTQPLPEGGMRMVFRFRLLNGCPTCDPAGYAYVAYDFSQIGALKQVSLISLQPADA